ncbi:MAG: dihydroneopterin aldolase [bacterium]
MLRIEGLRFLGRHGALEGEQERPQAFVVDVEAGFDAAGATASDDLERTVDVRAVHRTVQDVIGGPSCRLVETLAERIARGVLALKGVREVRIRVAKPDAAMEGLPGGYEVEVSRKEAGP